VHHKLKQVNLFVPGTAKSGTSSLHELLNLHPDINMSKNKEPHFFSSKGETFNSEIQVDNYLQNFDLSKSYIYRGESSTGYFYFENFKKNFIEPDNKDAKFILIFRNPIDRTISHYNYLKSLGSENQDLRSAILNEKDKIPSPNDILPERNMKNYYQYSLYGKWFKLFCEHFNKENIKIILFEELKAEPLKTINSCFEFLGLKHLEEISETKLNKTVKIRFPKIYRKIRIFAFNKSKPREVVKHLLPVKFRRKYKKHLTELILGILKTNKTLPGATIEQREWLKQLYSDDVEQLKTQTGHSFEQWTEFKSQ